MSQSTPPEPERPAIAVRRAGYAATYAERVQVGPGLGIDGYRLAVPGYAVTSVITPRWRLAPAGRDGFHVDLFDHLTTDYVQWTSLRTGTDDVIAEARTALAQYLAEHAGAPV